VTCRARKFDPPGFDCVPITETINGKKEHSPQRTITGGMFAWEAGQQAPTLIGVLRVDKSNDKAEGKVEGKVDKKQDVGI
jgi:hypothetical protein